MPRATKTMMTVMTTPRTTVMCSDSNGFFISGIPFRKPNQSIAKMLRRTYAPISRCAGYTERMYFNAERTDEQG